MFIEVPSFPDTLAYGGLGGPGFSTSIVALHGGNEQRNQRWRQPKHRWDVGQVNRSLAECETLLAFFYGVAHGRANGFRFKDFLPGESTGTDEPLGTGAGTTTAYQLRKRYTRGSYTFDRTIMKPIAGTVTLKADGSPFTLFDVNTTTGIVHAFADSGAVLTASFQFEVPVRFDVDDIAMQRVAPQVYSWPSIPLIELRRGDAGGSDTDEHEHSGWFAEWEFSLP